MQNISIETGLKEYTFNDKVTVQFNPTDSAFIGKIYNTFSELEEKQDSYEEKLKNSNTKELLQFSEELNQEMRDTLLDIFGVDVVTPLIGNANVYAKGDGLPIWANILLGVIDELDAAAVEENSKTNDRIAYYTKKYNVKDHQRKAKK